MRDKKISTAALLLPTVMWASVAVASKPASGDGELSALLETYLTRFKPVWLEAQQAWWEANTTGSDTAFARKKAADNALADLHSNPQTFARLKAMKESGRVSDPALRRQLDVMYRSFLQGQVDPALRKKIIDLENEVEQIFNTHRSDVGGKALTENDVRKILATTTVSIEAERAWKGYMAVGGKVEAKLWTLVALRNETARQLGFDNFYAMKLVLQEIDEVEFFKLFDELDELTGEPFARVKDDIDQRLAARFSIPVSDLRPWHFGDLFFQEAPPVEEVKLDDLFASIDMIALGRKYFAGIGLECDDILARSDLYEKPGKSPHAFCSDLDREGDIRVLCNLKPNAYWADTLLHELGHGVYNKYIRRDVPFLLRKASHGITTEGMAMMFGAMVKNEDWLARVRGMNTGEAVGVGRSVRSSLRTEKLVFCRWTQVMVRFEHGMYTNPDQNLGKLWWDLKKRYQLLSPPETTDRPDYAAKAHVLVAPVYYHNYMMGDLFAAQVRHFISKRILGLDDAGSSCFFGDQKVGKYLRDKVFGPGNLMSWNELTEFATGEPLRAGFFVEQFVR